MMRWSELHGDMQRPARERSVRRGFVTAVRSQERARSLASNRSQRNSLSGKCNLPRHPARGGSKTGSYRGSLPVARAANGNPEGSPSDPVTTDPKGEAVRASSRAATRRPSPQMGAYGGDVDDKATSFVLLRALVR